MIKLSRLRMQMFRKMASEEIEVTSYVSGVYAVAAPLCIRASFLSLQTSGVAMT